MALGIIIGAVATTANNLINIVSGEMFLFAGDSKTPIQCSICELHANNRYELAQYPMDDGQFISDTYYIKPQIISARVFVEGNKIAYLKNQLKITQESEIFFNIQSTFERQYSNLKLLEYSEETTSQVNSGAFFNLTFQEVITIDALVAGYNPKVQGSPSFAGENNEGVKKTQPQSALKIFTKGFGG